MCYCGKPNINGEPGYSWDGKTFGVRLVAAPALDDGDSLLYDEPGRCGGVDSHSHHFRVVKAQHVGFFLLVQHGGGAERISLGYRSFLPGVMRDMDSHARYWLLQNIYHVQADAVAAAKQKADAAWRQAAAEKRIKTRKQPRKGSIRVWIEPRETPIAAPPINA